MCDGAALGLQNAAHVKTKKAARPAAWYGPAYVPCTARTFARSQSQGSLVPWQMGCDAQPGEEHVWQEHSGVPQPTQHNAHVRQHANQAQSKFQRLPRTAEAESDRLSHSFGHAQDVEQPLQESVAR